MAIVNLGPIEQLPSKIAQDAKAIISDAQVAVAKEAVIVESEVKQEAAKIVEKIVTVEKIVEVPVEKIVTVIKEVPVEVEKIVTVIKEVPTIVEKEVIKEVEKAVEIIKEVPTEIKTFIDRIVVQQKIPTYVLVALVVETVILAVVAISHI